MPIKLAFLLITYNSIKFLFIHNYLKINVIKINLNIFTNLSCFLFQAVITLYPTKRK